MRAIVATGWLRFRAISDRACSARPCTAPARSAPRTRCTSRSITPPFADGNKHSGAFLFPLYLRKASAGNKLERMLKQLTYAEVLILDELGYLPMNRDEARLFFRVGSLLPTRELMKE